MKLHGNDPLKTARKNTVLSILMAAGICSALLLCMVMGNRIAHAAEDGAVIAEIK